MRTTMNLPMGRRRWKGDHAHAAATGKCRCRSENYFVVSRRERTGKEDEDLCEKRSLHVRNDDGSAAPSTRNGTKWVVVQGCWTAAPGGGDRNDCSNRSVYGNGSCLSLLVELLVAARAAKWKTGSRRPGKAR
jgi:hypothetical protein